MTQPLAYGRTPQEARHLETAELVAELSGVPYWKHDRAELAVAALRAALDQAKGDEVL